VQPAEDAQQAAPSAREGNQEKTLWGRGRGTNPEMSHCLARKISNERC
jgi:hypothetical protein